MRSLLLALALASPAGAESIEALRERTPSPELVPAPSVTEAGPVQEPLIMKPGFFSPGADKSYDAPLASFKLAERLDAHRGLLPLTLGGKAWFLSMAADAGLTTGFFTFLRGDSLVIRRLDLDEIRKTGSVYRLDASTVYRFKLEVSLLNPVRGSEFRLTPEQGTVGPRLKVKTGQILDALEENCVAFELDGKEYWVLYGTDVDPATNTLAKTRTLLFIREAGLGTKAWPVPEASLAADKPSGVALGDARIVLIKGSDGILRVLPEAR
ncbi:MAG TPA: hypothetical protein DCM05_05450 [Elusimicrobia bacterium]|nr:hypothetical protein [Elusimicrobiota bacterium]